jgi:hypothetical protein
VAFVSIFYPHRVELHRSEETGGQWLDILAGDEGADKLTIHFASDEQVASFAGAVVSALLGHAAEVK